MRKIRKDGEVLWVRETARAMLIKKRPVALIVCEVITEGKRAAETLRQVEAELAHANRVATMGQLTASIAHEVSQPIAGAAASGQAALRWLASGTPDLDAAGRAIERVIRDSNRAGEVFDRIRDIIKKAAPRKGSFDVNDAIREVVTLALGEAAKNGVSVQTDLADGLPLIHGDRVQVQQVMLWSRGGSVGVRAMSVRKPAYRRSCGVPRVSPAAYEAALLRRAVRPSLPMRYIVAVPTPGAFDQLPSLDIDLSFNRIAFPSVAPASSAAHLGHRRLRL